MACAPFVTSVVHGTDFVPTMNEHTLELLRQEVRSHARHLLEPVWCNRVSMQYIGWEQHCTGNPLFLRYNGICESEQEPLNPVYMRDPLLHHCAGPECLDLSMRGRHTRCCVGIRTMSHVRYNPR